MDFILLIAFHAAQIVSLILSSKCLYNAMGYIQSFLYSIDNHLLLRNCISLLISVSKLLFYLYPVKYRTILLNIYQQVMCRIAGVQRNMNNRIVCFVTQNCTDAKPSDIDQKCYKKSVVLNEQECFFLLTLLLSLSRNIVIFLALKNLIKQLCCHGRDRPASQNLWFRLSGNRQ